MTPAASPTKRVLEGRRGIPVLRILLGVAALAGLVVLGLYARDWLPRFTSWIDELGPLGPAIFILGYAVAVVAWVPGSALTLLAGAIFDLFYGTVYVLIGATLGASLAFLVARHLARDIVERRMARNEKFAAIDRAVGEQGLKIVLLMRLSPVFPFTAMNFLLGLTKVRFRDYMLASVGMLPGTLLYVYYGKVAGEAARLAGGVGVEKGAADYALLAIGLAATIAVTMVVTRAAQGALAQRMAE